MALSSQLDHSNHERDPDRVVHPRLALEDRPGTSADLARAKERERDGGVRRGDRRADEAGLDPAEAQEVARRERHDAGGHERAHHAERQDRPGRTPEAPESHVEPAVEEDHHERDDDDSLDRQDRQCVAHRGHERGDERGADEEEAGVGDREPVGEAHAEKGHEDRRGDREDDHPEVGDLAHRGVNLRCDADGGAA